MEFNIKEMKILLKGLTRLGGNVENWDLQLKIHNEIELDKNDDIICHFEEIKEEKVLTGFKEIDYPGIP